MEIVKAERFKSKLRLGIAGPAGSGKTMSALKLAKGLGEKICLIDTENGSGNLYGHLFEYDMITLKAPNYAPKNYIEAMQAAEKAGYDVIIIDSLSHAWVGQGGLLDQVDKKQGNSFTAWRDVTPQHNALVDAMLTSTKHIIATMRSKTEYGADTDKNGKMVVKKLGLAPVQREGMDYEFTVMMDVNQEHYATVSKDRTNMFANEVFQIDEKTGERLLAWLNAGKDAPDPKIKEMEIAIGKQKNLIMKVCTQLGFKAPEEKEKILESIQAFILQTTRDAYMPTLTLEELTEIYGHLKITLEDRAESGAGVSASAI